VETAHEVQAILDQPLPDQEFTGALRNVRVETVRSANIGGVDDR
jgi:hypothetical protein